MFYGSVKWQRINSLPSDVWDSDPSLKNFVKFWFVEKLRVSGLDRLELDGDLLAVGDVDAQVDVAETAAANFADLKWKTSNKLKKLFKINWNWN